MYEPARRFAALFRGNERSHGIFYPKTGKVETAHSPATSKDFEAHVFGKKGVGIVPIMDDDNCYFGAIDIDAHGDAPDIDLVQLEARVRDQDFPLTVCRSKSGGAHLYLFLSEPTPAKLVRDTLMRWAGLLGHAGCEVFPKQERLPVSGGSRQLGNWINLCYFDAEEEGCLRYAVEAGARIDFMHFLDTAESRRVPPAALVEKATGEFAEAPPCIQKMLTEGVGHGQRNEALYNVVVYLKKANPETWRDKALDINAKIFPEPLSYAEAKKTITSAGRRDYRYKCKEEPCRSRCNSAECVKRKFGITPEEKSELEIGTMPEFTGLDKYDVDPVKWVLHVENHQITLSTLELMDYRAVRRAVADNLIRLIPSIKNDKWEMMLNGLMKNARVIAAPEDASTYGVIKAKLLEFLRKTDLSNEGVDISDRDKLMLGVPVVQQLNNQRVVYFRGNDFIDYLKKNRSEELKGSNMWMVLRKIGVLHSKLRVQDTPIPVWYIPIGDDHTIRLEVRDMTPEI